jgi:hypothetical protein
VHGLEVLFPASEFSATYFSLAENLGEDELLQNLTEQPICY